MSLVQIFAALSVGVVTAALLGLVQGAFDEPHPERLEACGFLVFAGWFSAGVSLQLDGTVWTTGGVVSLPWLLVCSFSAMGVVMAATARRIDKTVYQQRPEEDS